MKDTETKLAFIEARAGNKSYDTISRELGIAKATCVSWEKALKSEISALRQARLEELYTTYDMTREARIKALGDLLERLDSAIAEKPLEDLPADKLLELRLKYGRELKEEYIEPVALDMDDTLDGLLEQYDQLYSDSKTGNATPAEIRARLGILDARRDAIYQIASERSKEEDSPFDFDFAKKYESKLIRHEAERGA